MGITVDVAYKSLNKFSEILCGDKVEMLQTEDSNILILADGMGSGVKANILSTLTSKILGTMFLNGATLEECVETIVQTLPICQVRQVAYSTFSILQVFHNGDAYLVEFDNPGCIFIRDGQADADSQEHPGPSRARRSMNSGSRSRRGDALILMSDGTIHAGVGQLLNFGWLWEDIAGLRGEAVRPDRVGHAAGVGHLPGLRRAVPVPARRRHHRGLYADHRQKPVHLMTGPARNPGDDGDGGGFYGGDEATKRIVCGGTSATIVSRVLKRPLDVSLDYVDPEIPPIAYMDGIDLVTEGVLTLNRVVQLLRRYVKNETVSEEFFQELDKTNGASMVAKMLIEDCTELHLLRGKGDQQRLPEPGPAL